MSWITEEYWVISEKLTLKQREVLVITARSAGIVVQDLIYWEEYSEHLTGFSPISTEVGRNSPVIAPQRVPYSYDAVITYEYALKRLQEEVAKRKV